MSRGKWEAKKSFNASRYSETVKELGITDREVCSRITKLHIVISKDDLYPEDPSKDRIVTCTPQYLTRAKKDGKISPSILAAIGKVIGVAPEFLSGEIGDSDLEFFTGTPDYDFHTYQDYANMSAEKKEEYFRYELFDLGIYHKWLKMDNAQRSYCHVATKEFINWLLDYVQPDKEGYEQILEFFAKTGVQLEKDPELRKRLFNTLAAVYRSLV